MYGAFEEETRDDHGKETAHRRGAVTTARPASVVEAFVGHAERAPERLCLAFEGEEWTYGRLRERAWGFAGSLRSWGLRPGERVAL